MLAKEDILKEIKRTAKENGGKPLGVDRFEKQTGIKPHDWGKFWARLGDAHKEAGFVPNQFQNAHAEDLLLEKLIGLMRKLGKFPTYGEIQVEKHNNTGFPDKTIFQRRLGSQQQLATKITEYCENQTGFDDVLELCKPIVEKPEAEADLDSDTSTERSGEVYLFKSGRYYKIGKTTDTVRRGKEIRIQLPQDLDLVHSIKTDDPSGIEAYWHKRFESKRLNGEWFDLNSSDVKAFRRWRRLY